MRGQREYLSPWEYVHSSAANVYEWVVSSPSGDNGGPVSNICNSGPYGSKWCGMPRILVLENYLPTS